jgi:hypothetical protein
MGCPFLYRRELSIFPRLLRRQIKGHQRRCPLIRFEGVAMTLQLYAQTFFSYGAKVLSVLYESTIPFEWRQLSLDDVWLFAQLVIVGLLKWLRRALWMVGF